MKISSSLLINFLFAGVILFLTRQVPLNAYSTLGNVFLIGLLLVSFFWKNRDIGTSSKTAIKMIFVWSIFLLAYAVLIRENSINLVFRFYIIILCLLLSHWVHLPLIATKKIFFFFILLQCFVLIAIEAIMNIFFPINSYLPVRFLFMEQGWGDVYTYDGFFYRVQIKGNALIPFSFFLTFLKDYTFKYKRILQIILLVSSIIAGNFAFLIAIFIFFVFWYLFNDLHKRKLGNKIIIFSFVFALSISSIIEYTQEILERKSGYSLGTRSDQVDVLITDTQKYISTFFWGNGLGNNVKVKTFFRDYTDNVYFEIQAMYFFNQLGVINTLIFISFLLYLAINKIFYKDLLFIYLCYIIYAVTNPYILDTTQIVVILILISISNERKQKNRLCSSPIQSELGSYS
jgi:O-antigen polymerase